MPEAIYFVTIALFLLKPKCLFVLLFANQRALTVEDVEVEKLVSCAVYAFTGAAITKHCRGSGFNNRNLFSHSSGCWRQA